MPTPKTGRKRGSPAPGCLCQGSCRFGFLFCLFCFTQRLRSWNPGGIQRISYRYLFCKYSFCVYESPESVPSAKNVQENHAWHLASRSSHLVGVGGGIVGGGGRGVSQRVYLGEWIFKGPILCLSPWKRPRIFLSLKNKNRWPWKLQEYNYTWHCWLPTNYAFLSPLKEVPGFIPASVPPPQSPVTQGEADTTLGSRGVSGFI